MSLIQLLQGEYRPTKPIKIWVLLVKNIIFSALIFLTGYFIGSNNLLQGLITAIFLGIIIPGYTFFMKVLMLEPQL